MAGPGPARLTLPAFYEFVAPDDWRAVDFISDLHLDASLPRTFDAWAAHLLHTPADAVFLLGDLFEVWVGDDARDAAFERRCVDVIAEASTRRSLAFMAGNRDFLLGAEMREACGLLPLPDPTRLTAWDRSLLLTHGDALCLADTEYQQLRTLLRSARWQSDFLALPLVERRRQAASMRRQSDLRRRAAGHAMELWADVDAAAAVSWMHAAGVAEMVHGHTHRPGSSTLAPGFKRHVLTDWDLDGAAPRAEVLRLTRDGLARVAPTERSG